MHPDRFSDLNDTKNFSLHYGDDAKKDNDGQDPATAGGIQHQAVQPQDIYNQESTQRSPKPETRSPGEGPGEADPADDGNIVIEGLENFSFTDMPQEELELRQHFNKFIEQMRVNEIRL
jgi:hypothetical protein